MTLMHATIAPLAGLSMIKHLLDAPHYLASYKIVDDTTINFDPFLTTLSIFVFAGKSPGEFPTYAHA
ncbi:MAG: hypothetical protein MJE68_02750, partial [Proteobacteria bacterium]|nr:hypothetical protein [Pseudomonadota bacterium]